VAIGIQDFETIVKNDYFYIDKTRFLKEWWESGDSVTLLARPRRFGKTLIMSMVEKFFSIGYAGRSDLFTGLDIWKDKKYRSLQGTYPVISLSFADVKCRTFEETYRQMIGSVALAYSKHRYLLEGGFLNDTDRQYFESFEIYSKKQEPDANFSQYPFTSSIRNLADYLYRYYGKKVILLLDEYDTPMQEAYVNGYWEELVSLTRSLFNAAFKTNPYLERGIMTGITRVSRESMFSDLNNLKVIVTTSDEYSDVFGFTEEEVFSAMDSFGYPEKEKVKDWYDGFTFGKNTDIYNPWSVLNYLDTGKLAAYWANTSSNDLLSDLLKRSSRNIKNSFEQLLYGNCITVGLDEQVVYEQLGQDDSAIWSLMLAAGYLKVEDHKNDGTWEDVYELKLTNYEVLLTFRRLVRKWFAASETEYNEFITALLADNVQDMNSYMNRIVLNTISYFDTGRRPSGAEPERFYHGLVLGLLVDLQKKYLIRSNRESGFGRYDIMLIPADRKADLDAIIIEFKVLNPRDERSLEDTVRAALDQIDKKQYDAELFAQGFGRDRIRHYGFAFRDKEVLIDSGF